jgi:hypothetical protein
MTLEAAIPSSLIETLKRKKTEVQETSDDCLYLPFGQTELFAFNLQRQGRKLYPYILKTGDFTVCLSNRKHESPIPSMQITVGSISCNNNLPDMIATFYRWCLHYGIVVHSEKVSRIDLYADLSLDSETLALWNQAKMVTRAEKVNLYYSNRRLTGLQVGAGDIVLRIYDKIQEMVDKQALHKADFFMEKWGHVEHVTRVEYQLRREAINSFCPDESDLQAVTAKTSEIWHYLTFDWFRQTAKAVDRLNRNQSRETTSAFWTLVQQAHQAHTSDSCPRDRKQRTINIKSLIDQAAGIMTTVCAALGHAHSDFFGILATAGKTLQDKMCASMQVPGFEQDFNGRVVSATVSF